MKWFKHYTDAHTNLKFQDLLEQYGSEGYGVYWACCELIGKESNNFQLKKPKNWLKRLFSILNLSESKINEILSCLADNNLISKKALSHGTLSIPKMKERCDNYTESVVRGYRASSEKVESKYSKIRLDKNRLDKIRKDKITYLTPTTLEKSPLKENEKSILKCFLELGYLLEEKKLNNFTVWLEGLQKDYPDKDLVANVKKWKDYFEEKPPTRHKNSFRNWVEKPYANTKPTGRDSMEFYEKQTKEFLSKHPPKR